jgi:hypothetical protein
MSNNLQFDLKRLNWDQFALNNTSDLQALRIDEHLMRIQEQGITFIRHGLAKQDREKHFGAKIFVPTYKETLGYMTRTLNQIIFFPSTKIRIFFSATLGIRIFF